MSIVFDFETLQGIDKNDFQLQLERFQIELLTPTALIPYTSEGTGILGRYDMPVIPGAIYNRNDIAEAIKRYPKLKLLKAKIVQDDENENKIKLQIQYIPTGQTTEVAT